LYFHIWKMERPNMNLNLQVIVIVESEILRSSLAHPTMCANI
jgi:hypothetical protein